jgi:hypothetical protein
MSTTELQPTDGDPPEDPSADTLAPARDSRSGEADEPRTEHPMPESIPSGGGTSADA